MWDSVIINTDNYSTYAFKDYMKKFVIMMGLVFSLVGCSATTTIDLAHNAIKGQLKDPLFCAVFT